MTHSDTQAPRANQEGRPCPPWCTADHGKIMSCMATSRATYGAHARLILGPDSKRPEVYASAAEGCVFVPFYQAEQLALFLEDLAGLEPERLRELAAGVRAVAAIAGEEL